MLTNARFDLTLPVVDLERAKGFYGGKLGLKQLELPGPEMASEMAFYETGDCAQVALYRRENPTKADHTSAAFRVEDVDATVEALSKQGVRFEQYDEPGMKTDKRGITSIGPFRGAFFKDTEGNTLSVVGQ